MASDWITIPAFADDKVQRARTFQYIAANLDLVKNPMLAITPGPAIAGGAWTFTSTGSWSDIDATYYNNSFTSQGNSILAIAYLRYSHSAANGVGNFRFMLDGVARGNSLGQFTCVGIFSAPETFCFADVLENVEAGDHTIKLQAYEGTAGTMYVSKEYACLALRTFEF